MPKQESTPNVIRKDIQEYLDREAERLELERKARSLAKLNEPLKRKMVAFVRANGGKARTVSRSGYVLTLTLVAGNVSWKDQFVQVAGIEAAERLVAEAPQREKLEIRPA